MGRFSEEVAQLCGEIRALRSERQAMKRDLEVETSERRRTVAGMRSGFSGAHREMAREARAHRRAFLSNLRGSVARRRHEFRADLAGARRAWLGKKG